MPRRKRTTPPATCTECGTVIEYGNTNGFLCAICYGHGKGPVRFCAKCGDAPLRAHLRCQHDGRTLEENERLLVNRHLRKSWPRLKPKKKEDESGKEEEERPKKAHHHRHHRDREPTDGDAEEEDAPVAAEEDEADLEVGDAVAPPPPPQESQKMRDLEAEVATIKAELDELKKKKSPPPLPPRPAAALGTVVDFVPETPIKGWRRLVDASPTSQSSRARRSLSFSPPEEDIPVASAPSPENVIAEEDRGHRHHRHHHHHRDVVEDSDSDDDEKRETELLEKFRIAKAPVAKELNARIRDIRAADHVRSSSSPVVSLTHITRCLRPSRSVASARTTPGSRPRRSRTGGARWTNCGRRTTSSLSRTPRARRSGSSLEKR